MNRFNNITDVPGIKVGNAEDRHAFTGCTVVLAEEGAVCGADVRGSAPGTRETDLLNPLNLVDRVHAICLSGGSAYGLDAASGVMQYLEERGHGLHVGVGVVPIVPAAVLFDLSVGNPKVRPDKQMGYQAASRAERGRFPFGNVGAGCGATIGKAAGYQRAMKGGLGSASRHYSNGLIVGAIVAVNAMGEIRDPSTGQILAGARDDDGKIRSSLDWMAEQPLNPLSGGTNTTIGAVASNANLTKAQACKVASMAHDGLARTIYPVHTMYDGDTLFALATGGVNASVDLVGAASAEVMAEAVLAAVRSAEGIDGFPSYRDLFHN
ncbi:P1 family peptidase [Lihuaxuella thermophila]|uniref:L-aminopeptidase/D-esterase n=1 Tax=Lihuaxuella thermophila TaxID=1173111 RepID=A0A1H8EJB8_9BACL|nr:P1 family peptidase [Lihuaxuella thermophila]SEN19585.1 L-aminopeptidase/D-esterase [Lihuaxuella thermophila]